MAFVLWCLIVTVAVTGQRWGTADSQPFPVQLLGEDW